MEDNASKLRGNNETLRFRLIWTELLIPLHKILLIPSVFYMARDFDAGKSISRAIGRGGPWKSRLFWRPSPPPHTFLCTEQFRNQQLYKKCDKDTHPVHKIILKVCWRDATLFVYFHVFKHTVHTSIPSHSYNTFIRRHSPGPLSISSSLLSLVGKTSLWCRAENRTQACLTVNIVAWNGSKPTRYQLSQWYNYRRSVSILFWATPCDLGFMGRGQFEMRVGTVDMIISEVTLAKFEQD